MLPRCLYARCWPLADIQLVPVNVRFLGVKRTWLNALHMSANDPKRTFPADRINSPSD
jgi:hypothetical protein